MRDNVRGIGLLFALILFWVGTMPAQVVKRQHRTLVVNGQTGPVAVVEVDGRSYVDLEALAQMSNGWLRSKENSIILAAPPASDASTPAAIPNPVNEFGLSQDFMRAGIEEIAEMREWATTLASAIQNGYQVTEGWVAPYREQAGSNLKLANIAAATEGDRNAFQLLNNEFDAVSQWSKTLVEARQNMDTAKYVVSPNALREDPLSQKIIACGRFLSSMVASGNYQDDASCH